MSNNDIVTVTVQNRAQAQMLHSINTASNLLAHALTDMQSEAERDLELLRSGKALMGGMGAASRNAVEYRTRLQTLLEMAGTVELEHDQVVAALSNDYIEINRLDRD